MPQGGVVFVDKAVEMFGPKLLKGDTEIDTATAFAGKTAVGLYFSAHWCPPCRSFTPQLATWYKDNLSAKGLEIIFVSSDRDNQGFKDYYKDMPWLALPFSEREAKEKLSKKFKVQGIPSFVILNAEDGSTITTDGRSAVSGDPTGKKFPWIPPTFSEALGNSFLHKDGAVGKAAIEGKTLGLYFSAHWCPPCRSFTPELAKWYAKMKPELGDKFEIIFCSGDKDEEGMKSYYKEQCDAGGDWLCLPFSAKDNLDGLFEVSGIPTFIIVSPEGKVINAGGRGLVPEAIAADFPWKPPPIGNLNQPEGINGTPSLCLMLDSVDAETQKRIIDDVTPIAAEYDAQDDKELLFFVAKAPGGIVDRLRGMCGLEGVKTDTPHILLLDIPDNGGYYVGKMAKEIDGSNIRAMIADWKAKKLERKQLA